MKDFFGLLAAETGFVVLMYFFLRFYVGCLGKEKLPKPINKFWMGGLITHVTFTIMCMCDLFGSYSVSFWAISVMIVCGFTLFGLYLIMDDSRKTIVQEEMNGLEQQEKEEE